MWVASSICPGCPSGSRPVTGSPFLALLHVPRQMPGSKTPNCCPSSSTLTPICCPNGRSKLITICCPNGSKLITICCPNGSRLTAHCCPNGSKLITICCPNGSKLTPNCCPNSSKLTLWHQRVQPPMAVVQWNNWEPYPIQSPPQSLPQW